MDRRRRELGLRRHEVDVREGARGHELRQRSAVEEVERRVAVRAPPETGRRVRLRVEIDEEAALSRLGKARGEVDRGGRLADAALLVRDRVDPGRHGVTVPAGPDASGSERGALAMVPGLRHEPLLAGSQVAERRAAAASPKAQASGALLRHARAAREPGRRRAGLADHEEPVEGRPRARRRPRGRLRSTRSRSADGPTQSTTAPPSRTSGRHHSAAVGGWCERLRDRDSVRLERLLLGPAPDDLEVRQLGRPALEELALSPLCLEQRDGPLGERRGERDAGCPAARPDVHDRAVEARDEPDARKRVLEQDASRLVRVADRGEARRRDDRRQPPFQELAQSAERRGRTTT